MKNPPSAKLGPHMVPTGGTLAQPYTIINAIASGSHAPMPNASSTPFLSSPKPSPYPTLPIKTLTHKDTAIQAARELTHALQQPRFRGPLAQFHDNYLTSLRELGKIFHTVTPGVETIAPGVNTTKANPVPPVPLPRPATQPNEPTTPTPTQHIPIVPYNLRPRTSRPHYAAPITHSETGRSMEYKDLITDPSTRATWLHSAANEFGRLAQGLPDERVEPTNTMFFIPFSQVPKHKRPTYARFVCSYRPQKAEPYRTRLTVGGNLIDYPGNLSMKVADMTTFKILVNSTLSTPGARWLGLDVKNYYLGTPMDDYEYMFIPITSIPDEIIAHYKLRDLVHNGRVYIEIRRGMYGLPQAGILADPFPRHLWLRTCPPHTRPMAAQMAPHQFLPRRRRLWRQIHRQRTCRPSHPMPPQPLPRS